MLRLLKWNHQWKNHRLLAQFNLNYSTDSTTSATTRTTNIPIPLTKPIKPKSPQLIYIEDKLQEYRLSSSHRKKDPPPTRSSLKRLWEYETPETWLKYQLKIKPQYEAYLAQIPAWNDAHPDDKVKVVRRSHTGWPINESYVNDQHHEPMPPFSLYLLDVLKQSGSRRRSPGLVNVWKKWKHETASVKNKYELIYEKNRERLLENGIIRPTKPLSPVKLFVYDGEKQKRFPELSEDQISFDSWDTLPEVVRLYYEDLHTHLENVYQRRVEKWNEKHPDDIVRRRAPAFFLFRDDYASKMKTEKGGGFVISLSSVSKLWESQSEEVKAHYEEKARLLYDQNKQYGKEKAEGDNGNAAESDYSHVRKKKEEGNAAAVVAIVGHRQKKKDSMKIPKISQPDETHKPTRNIGYVRKPEYASGKSLYINAMESSNPEFSHDQLDSMWNSQPNEMKARYERSAFEKYITMSDAWSERNPDKPQIDYFSRENVSKYVGFVSNRKETVNPFIYYVAKVQLSPTQAKIKWKNEPEEVKQQMRKEAIEARKMKKDNVKKDDDMTTDRIITVIAPRLVNPYQLFLKVQMNTMTQKSGTKRGLAQLWQANSDEIKQLYSDLVNYHLEISLVKCVQLKEKRYWDLGLINPDSDSGIITKAIEDRHKLLGLRIEQAIADLREMGEEIDPSQLPDNEPVEITRQFNFSGSGTVKPETKTTSKPKPNPELKSEADPKTKLNREPNPNLEARSKPEREHTTTLKTKPNSESLSFSFSRNRYNNK